MTRMRAPRFVMFAAAQSISAARALQARRILKIHGSQSRYAGHTTAPSFLLLTYEAVLPCRWDGLWFVCCTSIAISSAPPSPPRENIHV